MQARFRIQPVVWYRRYIGVISRLIDWIVASEKRLFIAVAVVFFLVAGAWAYKPLRILSDGDLSSPVYISSSRGADGYLTNVGSALIGPGITAALGIGILAYIWYTAYVEATRKVKNQAPKQASSRRRRS